MKPGNKIEGGWSEMGSPALVPERGTSWDTVKKGEIPVKGEDDPDRVARVEEGDA